MKIVDKGLITLCLVSLFFAGCSDDKIEVNETKPIPQVHEESKQMEVSDLEKVAKAYMKAIEAKKPELKKLEQKIKGLSLDKMLSDGTKELAEELKKLANSIQALEQRLNIYIEKLKEKNVDVNELNS